MIKNILLLSVILLSIQLSAQTGLTFPPAISSNSSSNIYSHLESDVSGQGKVTITNELALDSLIALAKQVNQQNGMDGYTVQLFRGNNGQVSRKAAESIKSEYLSKNPEGKINVVYTNPNWRVQVGAFRTYAEAMKEKVEIEKLMSAYKDQIYIVRHKLNNKDLKPE